MESDAMPKVDTWMHEKITAAKNNNCTLDNAAVRREWCVIWIQEHTHECF